ncbi:MAG: hypothetical protein ACPG1C_11065, partial [Alphaproteobacteria bacterium]
QHKTPPPARPLNTNYVKIRESLKGFRKNVATCCAPFVEAGYRDAFRARQSPNQKKAGQNCRTAKTEVGTQKTHPKLMFVKFRKT